MRRMAGMMVERMAMVTVMVIPSLLFLMESLATIIKSQDEAHGGARLILSHVTQKCCDSGGLLRIEATLWIPRR